MDDRLKISKQVLKKCCKTNGAIIVSYDSNKNTKDYRYVWPRDAAFVCVAANKIGINNIQEKFFRWCIKAEGWKETGLLYKKYNINGKQERHAFQPDSTGLVLWAIYDYYQNKEIPKDIQNFIKKTANALCKIWNKDHFKIITEDLWEERKAYPELKQNFLFSIAACSLGLKCAYELLKNKTWLKKSNEMKKVILKQKEFYRKIGKIQDKNIDASLLGLVYPCNIIDIKDKRMQKVIKRIEKEITIDKGIHRYKNDDYDGWLIKGKQAKQGSGYWPLLNLWMYKVTNNKEYYNKVLKDTGNLIPEQVFNNKIQKSVTPLAWAHAMFILK